MALWPNGCVGNRGSRIRRSRRCCHGERFAFPALAPGSVPKIVQEVCVQTSARRCCDQVHDLVRIFPSMTQVTALVNDPEILAASAVVT